MVKKRVIKCLTTVILCTLILLLIWNLTDNATVVNGDLKADISFANSWKVRVALMLEKSRFDGAGCPFSTDYSVKMGGLTYCLAQDDCNTVYIPELNIYYTVPKEKFVELNKQMTELFAKEIRPDVSKYTFATFEKKGENGYKLITGEIASLYTFDSLQICPSMEVFGDDWLYRIVFNPNTSADQNDEYVVLFGEHNLSLNGLTYTAAEGVSYSDILEWVSSKYNFFDYELQSK